MLSFSTFLTVHLNSTVYIDLKNVKYIISPLRDICKSQWRMRYLNLSTLDPCFIKTSGCQHFRLNTNEVIYSVFKIIAVAEISASTCSYFVLIFGNSQPKCSYKIVLIRKKRGIVLVK